VFSVNLYQVQRINYFENLLTSSLTNTAVKSISSGLKNNNKSKQDANNSFHIKFSFLFYNGLAYLSKK
jgi:hypothetical protein